MSEEVQAPAAQVTPEAAAAPAEVKPPVAETKPAAEAAAPPAEVKKDEPAKDGAPESKEAKKVVPEKYDLKLPEDSMLDASVLEKVASIAKKQGLSNEEAQAFLDQEHEAVTEAAKVQSERWRSEVESDKEIGGEGFGKNIEMAHRVLKRFGSDPLNKELNRTGYGNHPELVRLLVKIGKSMSEDQLVMPGAQPGAKKSIEDVFYPKHNKEI